MLKDSSILCKYCIQHKQCKDKSRRRIQSNEPTIDNKSGQPWINLALYVFHCKSLDLSKVTPPEVNLKGTRTPNNGEDSCLVEPNPQLPLIHRG